MWGLSPGPPPKIVEKGGRLSSEDRGVHEAFLGEWGGIKMYSIHASWVGRVSIKYLPLELF